MTKTKRNLVLIVSLLFAMLTLCSVFAIAGLQTSQTVEAATLTETEIKQRRAKPGLYETGTTTLKTSWDDLISNGDITTTNGVLNVKWESNLEGDLVFGSLSGITSISYAFNCCQKLTSIDATALDVSKVVDMSYAFAACLNVTELDLSGWDTSAVENMTSLFTRCDSLKEIDLSDWNTSAVTDLNGLFWNDKSLTTVNLNGWDTSKVKYMCNLFYNCKNLKDLKLDGWKTNAVTTMSSMFSGCSSLAELDIGSLNTVAVTSMDSMFANCSSLQSLNLSGWDTKNVTTMENMFFGCSSLKSLDLKNFDTKNVTSMRMMFCGCSSLTTLDVSNFDTSKVSDFVGMFAGIKLKELNISNFDFSGCASTDWETRVHSVLGMLGFNENGSSVEDMESFLTVFGIEEEFHFVEYVKGNKDLTETIANFQNDLEIVGSMAGFDFVEWYAQAIEGKDETAKRKIGWECIMTIVIWYDYGSIPNEFAFAEQVVNTRIEKIYAPKTVSGSLIDLPDETSYVAEGNEGTRELTKQVLYGYNDLNMTAGTSLVAKTPENDKTEAKLDKTTIIIACAIAGVCIIALMVFVIKKAVVSTNRKNGRF